MSRVHALHGFLGNSSDWHGFNIPNLHGYSLFDADIKPGQDGFWGWAKRFNRHTSATQDFILGYSLGGRLSLHALLDNPGQWKGAIIISSHPGKQTEEERTKRLLNDDRWAKRFENDPWNEVVADWEKQTVFGNISHPLTLAENRFSKYEQAHLLRSCSRGLQEDLTERLQNVNTPILWICGELDTVFNQSAKELKFTHTKSRVVIIPGAAHRVPWEQPELFTTTVNQFINEVS